MKSSRRIARKEKDAKYLEVQGLTKENRSRSRQLLINFDTYGFPYWSAKDIEWTETTAHCLSRDILIPLEESEIWCDKTLRTLYFYENYMLCKGDHDGRYVLDTYGKCYRYYKGLKQ